MNKKIRLLIVDDSYFIRKTLVKLLTQDDIEIIDTASNGKEGYEKIKTLKPDIVTMDIEMPIMTGLEALKKVMEENPVPVIMVSTLTSEGAESTLEALSLGAVDFIAKKSSFTELHLIQEELLSKIRNITKSSSVLNRFKSKIPIKKDNLLTPKDNPVSSIRPVGYSKTEGLINRKKRIAKNDIEIICIGISTGGPAALHEVLPSIPGNLPVPIVIAQHMPPYFTKSLADRLNEKSKIHIKEGENGDILKPGYCFFAPGGKQMLIGSKNSINISTEPASELYKPSVNILMNSVIDSFGGKVLGLIMTGMGHDGGIAFKRLNEMGGYILAQDTDTCVVSGMPKTVIDMNIANEIVPLNEIANTISSLFNLK